MGLQLIYGKVNSGKTEFILNKSFELYNDNKPFIIVVPEQYTHLAEKKLISKIGSMEQGRAEVLSFDRIATRINSMYFNSKKRLSKIAKTLIMSEIISGIDFKYYKNASKDSGFVEVCINEISELKKYNISAVELEDYTRRTKNESLALKLKDICQIYKAYDDKIADSFADSDDSLGILADNLDNNKPYYGYTFIFDEFSSFNPSEKKVIAALSKQADAVYVTMCADFSSRNRLLFKPTLNMAQSIVNVCKSAGCEICDPVELKCTYYKSDEMKFLENNIYSFPAEKYKKPLNDICVNIFDNPYSEVCWLASKIKSVVETENLRFKDIGVICADISSYSHIIRHVFDKYNIPYFVDEKMGVLKHSIIGSVIDIFDVYLSGYSAESVVSYLKSAYVNIDRQSLVDVENFISVTNASKNTWLIDERWNKTLEIYCTENKIHFDSLNNIRNNYILPLASLHDKIKGKNTVKFITENLYRFLVNSNFDKAILGFIERFKLDNNKYLAKQYELVWKVFIEALDTIVLILGDKMVNISQYRNYLYTSLREQKIGIIPTSLDSVTIGDIKRSKSDSNIYQFIIGTVDGVFPGGAKASSVITDAEKNILLSDGITLSPDSKEQAYYDRFLTYTALCGASKSLILSYPTSDGGADAKRPSFVFTLLKNIFPNIKFNSYINKKDEILLTNQYDSLEFLTKQIMAISDKKSPDPKWQDIYKFFDENSKNEIDFVDSVTCKTEQIAKIDKSLCDLLFKDEFYSTISRLQRYNACRYSYYLEYMLGLKDKKSFDPESTDIGTFVHACIEKAFLTIDLQNKSIADIDKEYVVDILNPIFDECIPIMYLYPDELTPKDEFKLSTLKNNVINAIMNIRSHFANSSFKPLGHEITFDDENFGCIEITLNNNKNMKLTGKIDRADYFENEDGRFLRVVDYKTGSKTFNFSDVYYGLDIQLIVYLNALVKNTNNAHHAGSLFFRIQNPIAEFDEHPEQSEINQSLLKLNAMTGLVADDEHVLNAYSPSSITSVKKASFSQFSALSDYVESVLKQSAENLSNGAIDINPYKRSSASPCNYCKFSKICNFVDGQNGQCRNLGTVSEKVFLTNITKSSKEGTE